MVKGNLVLTTDLGASVTAKASKCELKVAEDVKGCKVTLLAKPSLPTFDKSGMAMPKNTVPVVDLSIAKDDYTLCFDAIDTGAASLKAPKLVAKKKLDVNGNKVATELTYTHKNKTLKCVAGLPTFMEVSPKVEATVDASKNTTAKVELSTSKKVEKVSLGLKVDYNSAKVLNAKLTAARPLTDDIKLTVDINQKQEGVVAASCDIYSLECPYTIGAGPAFEKTALKIKYTTDF